MTDIQPIGTCGICGGMVGVPRVWLGTIPPRPACQSCGAHPKNAYGPTLEMTQPAPNTNYLVFAGDRVYTFRT